MNSIIVIGAGQLGSRHLQALGKSERRLSIDVMDASLEALETAKSRWAEIKSVSSTAEFYTERPSGRNYDLAVIATTALARAEVTKQFLAANKCRYIVFEKFLFPKIEEYQEIAALLEAQNVTAWVNCPRRMHPVFAEIRPYFNGPIRLSFEGGQWGLGCNSIHLADLAAYFCGQPAFEWLTGCLDNTLLESRRPGYVEFTGTLLGTGADGSTISLHAQADSSTPPFLQLIGEKAAVRLDESFEAGALYLEKNNWKPESLSFHTPFQSELTHILAEEILSSGSCRLTTYQESIRLHLPLLAAFINHLKIMGIDKNICPIT